MIEFFIEGFSPSILDSRKNVSRTLHFIIVNTGYNLLKLKYLNMIKMTFDSIIYFFNKLNSKISVHLLHLLY